MRVEFQPEPWRIQSESKDFPTLSKKPNKQTKLETLMGTPKDKIIPFWLSHSQQGVLRKVGLFQHHQGLLWFLFFLWEI